MPSSKKKAAAGAGNIRKKTVTRNGKEYTYWEARLIVGFDPGTGRQKQRSITGKTQKEVRQKLNQLAAEVDNGTYMEPLKMTLGEWLDTWADTYLNNVKPMTVLNYNKYISKHIKPALGNVRLDKLESTAIQRFYNDLGQPHNDKPGLSPKTVRCIHGVLHKALQQAVALGYLRSNPTGACTLPRVQRKEIKPLDSSEIGAFMRAVKGHPFEALYLTTLFTGMRRGEVCGLTWDCVNLEKGQILINKQLQNIPGQPGKYRFVSLKNDKSRSVALASFLVDVLKQHKAHQNTQKERAAELWQETGFVFTNEIGEHLAPGSVYNHFKRLAVSIGLPTARFHDLRHSYAVASLRAGDDIKTVQENLGHHTAAFTLDVYGHITEEMKRDSADRMNAFIKSISPQ